MLLASCVLMTACTAVPDVFECTDSAQCRVDGKEGRCEASGFCSLPAPDCPSGWQYDASAGEPFRGACVLDTAVDCAMPFTPVLDAETGRCAPGAIEIDGNLVEWPDGLFATLVDYDTSGANTGTWTENRLVDDADLSARVAWQWDGQYLYVAARIRDNDIVAPHPTASFWENDVFELFLDGNGDRTGEYLEDDYQLIVRHDGMARTRRAGNEMPALASIEIGVASRPTEGEWDVEIAFPFAALGTKPVVAGRVIGIDVVLADREDLSAMYVAQTLTWSIATSLPANCSVTCLGMCVPSCSTSHFAQLQLVGP